MEDSAAINTLIRRMAEGDQDAFEKLFHLYHKKVYLFAVRLLPSAEDAEEVVQNVFLSIWNQREKLYISVSFSSYLFGIVRHMVYSFIERKVRHEAFVEYYIEHNLEYSFVTEEDVLFRELENLLHRLIQELPERRREIFKLSRVEGLSYKEISERLGISENTVDTQIRHALAHLRSYIVEYK
jgi:RNA polymerase sigma-70 factor, ECF subfamily